MDTNSVGTTPTVNFNTNVLLTIKDSLAHKLTPKIKADEINSMRSL